MKKISVVFALLMMLGFAGASSAATLSWTSLQAGASNTLDNDTTITAQYGFGSYTGGFSHDYSLSAAPASPVLAFAIELLNENINIANITLDGVAMAWDNVQKRWFGTSLSAGAHTIHLDGSVTAKGQQYQLNVSSVPVPAAIWLFGSAIAGLIGFSRRKAGLNALTA